MRILNLVAGQKWTGIAAVVFDQTAALVAAGVEAQFGFVGDSPLAERLLPLGWARPLMTPRRGPLAAARESRILADTLARERFDVVHAHATHDHWLALRAIRGARPRPRLVRTIHNLRHARGGAATRFLFGRTDAFSFGNREIASAFGKEGSVHSPVIDAGRFVPADSSERARAAAGLPRTGILAGTVGKMADGRGHPEAIRAAAAVAGVTLVHVGHGERMPDWKGLAASCGAAERNVWLGYREDDLPELYRAWDMFVFPASGSEQGQRAILEAMASGIPVVALAVPGVSDLITDGVEGIVARSERELSEGIARLARDPALARSMGARGRERALAFTGERYAARVSAFYEEVLRENGAARATRPE